MMDCLFTTLILMLGVFGPTALIVCYIFTVSRRLEIASSKGFYKYTDLKKKLISYTIEELRDGGGPEFYG